jgi:hypothetical protein
MVLSARDRYVVKKFKMFNNYVVGSGPSDYLIKSRLRVKRGTRGYKIIEEMSRDSWYKALSSRQRFAARTCMLRMILRVGKVEDKNNAWFAVTDMDVKRMSEKRVEKLLFLGDV